MKAKRKTVKPQTTIVHVAVTTAGPVPMKAVREWVLRLMEIAELPAWLGVDDWSAVTKITVKRDANIERP